MNIPYLYKVILCLCGSVMIQQVSAQELLLDQWYWPQYELPRNAARGSELPEKPPQTSYATFEMDTDPLLFMGQHPTQRIKELVPSIDLPSERFTAEMWILDHVNQPIGSVFTTKSMYKTAGPAWVLGYFNQEIFFQLHTDPMEGSKPPATAWNFSSKNWRGFKRYFAHIVATYDGTYAKVYVNGALLDSMRMGGYLAYPDKSELESAAYLSNEPYMELGNHLLNTRLWQGALSQNQIRDRYQELQEMVIQGEKYPDTLHFTAGPYLHMATQTSINLSWETNRPTTAKIAYGKTLPLDNEVILDNSQTLHDLTIDGLEPETPYYYQITANEKGEDASQSVSSGVLTFATAVKAGSAFAFVAFGDTEARPHINHRMGNWIWEERPNFVINLGDLTDGGQTDHKFQWNYEYFQGMTPLNSRIPVFPVAGNGESDLYWYKQYHKLPNEEAYYTFTYGNAAFFMLNSNEKDQLKPGGEQYEWLETQLRNSTATWKFACHHHAAFSSDENDYGNTWEGEASDLGDLQVRELVELYETYGVDIVFYGHLHTYERTWPIQDMQINPDQGVVYLVAGGAGGNLEDFTPTRSWFTTKLYRGHHYCRIDIHGDQLYFKMYDLNGALKDYMEIEK